MPRTGWLGVLVGFGCASDTPQHSAQDRATYQALVSDRRVEPAAGFQACAQIVDPTLAGDCALHVASVEARRPSGRPARWCGEVPAGVWRDECWFVAAEQANRGGRAQEAADFCQKSQAFVDDCAQHLWQSEVRALVHRQGSRGFAHAIPAAQAVHARWQPLLGEQTDFEQRFWVKFFQNGFEGQGGFVDLAHCDALAALDPVHASRCVDAGVQLYDRDLDPRLSRSGTALCALTEGEAGWSTTLLQWVPSLPDPRLDAVVAQRVANCE